jgi:hypothetical protein
MSGVDYVVMTRNLSPSEDALEIWTHIAFLTNLLKQEGKQLKHLCSVGNPAPYHFSAEVFGVVADSTLVRRGVPQ